MSASLHGGLLIGGQSTRMGRPKHLLEYEGVAFIERVVRALDPHVDELIVLGAGELPEQLTSLARIDDVPDVSGPLAGLIAAMRTRPEASWLIAACDLPFITDEAVAWLCTQRDPQSIATMPTLDPKTERVEPLLAIYEPVALAALESLAEESHGPSALAKTKRVHKPRIPQDLASAWHNVNTPSDLRGPNKP